MKTEPMKSLLTGYGVAGLAGAGLAFGAAAPVAGVAIFWLGGAALTLGVAALRAPRVDIAAEEARRKTEEAEYLASIARWEQERRASLGARKTG